MIREEIVPPIIGTTILDIILLPISWLCNIGNKEITITLPVIDFGLTLFTAPQKFYTKVATIPAILATDKL